MGLACFLPLLLNLLAVPASHGQELQEYEAKALLLYNFAKSTSWPEGSFEDEKSPIKVGVISDREFFTSFKKYQDKLVNGHPLIIERLETVTDFKTGHILYIQGSWTASIKFYINYLSKSNKPILTVGESLDFVLNGGMISIVHENDHLALLTNPKATKDANLFLSRNLINLSKQVSGPTEDK